MEEKRKFIRIPKLEEKISAKIVIDDAEILNGLIIDVSYQGVCVEVSCSSDLQNKDVGIKIPDFDITTPLHGKVVHHERKEKDILHIFIAKLTQKELLKLLKVCYPDASRSQINGVAEYLIEHWQF